MRGVHGLHRDGSGSGVYVDILDELLDGVDDLLEDYTLVESSEKHAVFEVFAVN